MHRTLTVLLVLTASLVSAQTKEDSLAIRATALNYVEGWYEGNADRMEKALHPELAKRIVNTNPENARSNLQHMSALSLILRTRNGGGKDTPKEKQEKDVYILDVYQNAASAKAIMSGWVDYLHMAKWNGEWRIVNVLWELKPPK